MKKERNWEDEGKDAVQKFHTLVECTVEASREACEAAAKKGSAKKEDIDKEVSTLLDGLAAISVAGMFLIAALVQSRKEADKLRRDLATYKEMDELDSKQPDANISETVGAMMKKYLN